MSTNHLNRDALIIGICQYGDLPMLAQLNTLAEQAEVLAHLLETQGGFKVTRLPCATDLTLDLKKRVTLPQLEQAIEKLLYPPAESPTQTALLFFAGHGLVKETKLGKEGFLATSEADSRSVYGFSLKTLRDLLRNSPIKQQIVFLESCHSGEFFTHFQADEKRDYCFVTSARAHEAALAEGLLTKALLDILDYTHQPKGTPWVNSDTLIEGLRQKLPATEGWQRFEMQTQGHLMLTNYAFSQQVDPNAKPYKGLHYFDNKPEDALFFKGREKLIAELLTKVTEKSFLAILGASGNGKSSVVRAGVLYQLQQTERWQIVNPFTPTANPLTALTNGLGTTDVLTLVTSANARVILTIDQFEEVFSLCQDGQARDTFFNTLLDAVEQATGKLCLIVVMRADFLDKCSNYPRLASYFQDHQHIVTRQTEAEIQQIIESPAKQAGLSVEPRLVAEMITDFKDSLGGLPLLEFTLTTLWEKGKADRLLRYADYQALGGIQGILEKKATETYEKTLTPAEQVVAKRVFLELTELGEGKPDTRRLVPQTDLLGFTTTQTSVEQVIAKLVKEHLIVTDKTAVTVVNIAHDALIEHWSMLRKWLDQSREDLKLQRQINEGAKAWKVGKKALLVGVDLARAEEYLGTHLEKVPLSESGVAFVKKSQKERDRILKMEKERQEQELRVAKQLVEESEARRKEQSIANQRLRKRAVVLTIFLVMACVATGIAWLYREEAKKQRDIGVLRFRGAKSEITQEYSKALDYYQQALELSKNTSDKEIQANGFSDTGRMYKLLADRLPEGLKSSEWAFEQALVLRHEIGEPSGIQYDEKNLLVTKIELWKSQNCSSSQIVAGTVVGFINSFNCPTDAYEIHRICEKSREPLTLALGEVLYKGDILIVKEKCEQCKSDIRCIIELQTDSQPIQLSSNNSPYIVTGGGKLPSITDNLRQWLERIDIYKQRDEVPVMSVITR